MSFRDELQGEETVGMTRVFVYGSLKRGFCNHRVLGASRCLGGHASAPRYTMYDLGPYPAVLPRGRGVIHGEVYEISARVLAALDALEDYPRVYDRIQVATPFGRAWMYVVREAMNHPVVPDGVWLEG